jgi:hypothetical protein
LKAIVFAKECGNLESSLGWPIMNRTIAFFLSILLCSIDVGFASAEETGLATGGGKVRVLRQDMQKRTSGGVIDGCEITFTVAFEDFIYKKGGISFAQGGIALWGQARDNH